MPGFGMGQSHRQNLSHRLEQRQMLRQALMADDFIEPFRTEEEKSANSQYALIEELKKRIADGEYIDPTHFALEINRNVFSRSSSLAGLGGDLSKIVKIYKNENLTSSALDLLGSIREEEKKDLPALMASSIRKSSQSGYFQPNQVLDLANQMQGVASAGLDILADSGFEFNIANTTLLHLQQYANADSRIIPFAQSILKSAFSAIKAKGEFVSAEQASQLYTKILESMYMLDRDQRSPLAKNLEKSIIEKGLARVLESQLPVPIQLALENVSQDLEGFIRLCDDDKFRKGREIQRKIYQGLSIISNIENYQEILNHAVVNSTDSNSLSKILSAIDLGHSDPEFNYPLDATGESNILTRLRSQLVDKGIKRLNLKQDTLEKYIERLDSDDRFARLSNVFTTLASYSHYSDQIPLLREMINAELENKYLDWRYEQAAEQLTGLDEKIDAWKQNAKSTRLVGEQYALQSHIESVKDSLPRIKEAYAEHYKNNNDLTILQSELKNLEESLRSDLSNKDRKTKGYEASLLRDQLAYAKIINLVSELDISNYKDLADLTQNLLKNKKHPLYDHAKWLNETLDQPVYRQARKITITETDDLEKMLTFGEAPVPHCQNWKVNSTLNKSLASFASDPNKKLFVYADQSGKEFAMSLLRYVDWDKNPTLLIENVYAENWSEDYGIALVGMLADKALAMAQETGKRINLASNNDKIVKALETFGKKYKVELQEGKISMQAAPSRNHYEYWDCGPGLIKSGSEVNIKVSYVKFE